MESIKADFEVSDKFREMSDDELLERYWDKSSGIDDFIYHAYKRGFGGILIYEFLKKEYMGISQKDVTRVIDEQFPGR